MTELRISFVKPTAWEQEVASKITEAVLQACIKHGSCTVLLTGGRSAERLYKAWSALPKFTQLRNVHFYFGDERCVPPGHAESVYGLAMRSLFQQGIPKDCTITRMHAEQLDREAAAEAYGKQLPSRLDVMLLSVGEDGHVASLFPHNSALLETRRRVVPVHAPKPPPERLTVTPLIITQAAQVFVMAIGSAKASVFRRAQSEPNDILALPARLVLNATWFLDTQLAS